MPSNGAKGLSADADEPIVTRCAPPHSRALPSHDREGSTSDCSPVTRRRGPVNALARFALTATATAGIALILLPASANAKIVEALPGTKVGVQDRNAFMIGEPGEDAATFANATGKPVLHAANIYAIYWDPEDQYDGDWQRIIDEFLGALDASEGSLSTVFAVNGQYRDSTGKPATSRSSYRGSYTDTNAYPEGGCTDPNPLLIGYITCLTDTQIRDQLQDFISEEHLPRGMSTIYYVLTPPGVTVCLDDGGPTGHCSDHTGDIPETLSGWEANESYRNSFCSYHGAITPTAPETGNGETILYGMIPWTAGGAGMAGISPSLAAYDCQDGGFDPSTEPPFEHEHIDRKPREELEVHVELELDKIKEECRKSREEVEGAEPATSEIEHSCKAKEEALESSVQPEFEALAEAEELEEPHVEEPHQAPEELDQDGDYDQGLADVIIGQIANEQQNIVTDPLLDAWHDSAGYEDTDECRNLFWTGALSESSAMHKKTRAGTLQNQLLAGDAYYLQESFLLGAGALDYPDVRCNGGISLEPSFTVPSVVNADELVGFNGMESTVTLNWAGLSLGAADQTYATYTWEFGDGTPPVSGYAPGAPICTSPWLPPCAASVFHSYAYGGEYDATLTITDTGGNTASVTHVIRVVGPPAPSTTVSGGSSGSSGSAGASGSPGSSGSSGSTAGNNKTYPPPVAYASASSASLKTAVHRGLSVRYNVSEQVAGTLQALISARLAHRLHIHAPTASGLPAGFEPSVVIGKAVIVTRKGGSGAVKVKFSKAVAAALSKLRKVKVTLRMVVRNASSTKPESTSLITTVVLKRGR